MKVFLSVYLVILLAIIVFERGNARLYGSRLRRGRNCRPKVCACRITAEVKTIHDAIKKLETKLGTPKCKIEQEEINKRTGRDCAELYKKGIKKSGVYKIKPFTSGLKAGKTVTVYCDMKTTGGGWTVFQRRVDGSVDFYKNWAAYRRGFGHKKGSYWLGLDAIHALTKHRPSQLRVDLEKWSGAKAYANYGIFSIGSSSNKYRLHLARYSGTAGDALTYANGMYFTTFDQDNDKWTHNCAVRNKGAWWYRTCHYANLNGHYYHTDAKIVKSDGVDWYQWGNMRKSVMRSEMKVRPQSFTY